MIILHDSRHFIEFIRRTRVFYTEVCHFKTKNLYIIISQQLLM